MYLCLGGVCWQECMYPRETEDDVEFSGAGLTDCCELHEVSYGTKYGLLQEQDTFSTF